LSGIGKQLNYPQAKHQDGMNMPRKLLNWANSQTIGGVTEIAVLAPIKQGRIPLQRRTYEERLRLAIANLASRVKQGIPTDLDKVTTIHFGRMIVIRPEQFLVYSDVFGVKYEPGDDKGIVASGRQIPAAIDDYREIVPEADQKGGLQLGAGSDPAAGQQPTQKADQEASQSKPDQGVGQPAAKTSTAGDGVGKEPQFCSWLLTLVEFDGDLRAYFRDTAQFLSSDFDSVFQNCIDFPSTKDFEAFWAWIRRYQIETDLFYPRYRDLSVARIKQLQDFKRRFDAFVATVRSPTGPRVKSMDELFDEFLRKTQQYARDFPAPGGTYKPGVD
jgi:hypothetical protein